MRRKLWLFMPEGKYKAASKIFDLIKQCCDFCNARVYTAIVLLEGKMNMKNGRTPFLIVILASLLNHSVQKELILGCC